MSDSTVDGRPDSPAPADAPRRVPMRTAIADVLGLMSGLRGFRKLFTYSLFAMLGAQILLVLLTAVSVHVSSLIISGRAAPADTTWFLAIIIGMACMQGFMFLLECWWSHELAYRVLASLRVDIFNALRRIAPRGLQSRRTADVASRSMSDVEQLEWFYAHTAATAVNALICSIVLIAANWWFIGPLALILVPGLILMVLFPISLVSWQRRQGDQMRRTLSDLKILSLDGLHGLRELHVMGLHERHRADIRAGGKAVQDALRNSNLRKTLEVGFADWIMAAVHIIVLVVLTAQVRSGTFDVSDLPVSVVLAATSAIPVVGLVKMLSRAGEIGSCASRVQELLNAPETVPSEPLPGAPDEERDGSLRAEKVSFAYEPDHPDVLTDVDVTVPAGRTVAIFGPSGVGKSTFAFLALRFLDPTSGIMRFDGRDMRTVAPDAHREHVTLLPQSSYIFSGTIRGNLTVAAEEATDDEPWHALRLSGLEKLVQDLGGLDAVVGDRGTTLSGGERQRLGLARVFLRDYETLILDEPLANVDPKLEHAIISALHEHREGKSTVIIAHRLASISDADLICVLEEGRVADVGTHAELAGRCPQYRTALATQRGGA
ncbi:ABC transporter ATP-binding protein [Corynebacterium sp. 335C]